VNTHKATKTIPTSQQQADMSSDPTNVARETSSDGNSGPGSAPVERDHKHPILAANLSGFLPINVVYAMQVVQEFVGYTTSTWSFTAYILLTAFSGGLIWIFGYFFPQVLTWTMHKSPLGQAQYVQAKVTILQPNQEQLNIESSAEG
jgi:hypothetical protein